MSGWDIFILICCMVAAIPLALFVWASISVRQRHRDGVYDEPSSDEMPVMGCEGDCNSCPLMKKHSKFRKPQLASLSCWFTAFMGLACL